MRRPARRTSCGRSSPSAAVRRAPRAHSSARLRVCRRWRRGAGMDVLRRATRRRASGAAARGIVFAGMSPVRSCSASWVRWRERMPRRGGDVRVSRYCAVRARYARRGRRLERGSLLRGGARSRGEAESQGVRDPERRRAARPQRWQNARTRRAGSHVRSATEWRCDDRTDVTGRKGMSYSRAHWRRVVDETRRMVAEVPLYRDRPQPPADPAEVDTWLAQVPAVGKRELRRGFPRALVREHQDLNAAMRSELVTLLATSGTTSDRLQVIWEWSWWDPQEREAMRLNARIARTMQRPDYREAVLTTPACGAGTCHFGSQTAAERSIDGILFFNESADPTHWTDGECDRCSPSGASSRRAASGRPGAASSRAWPRSVEFGRRREFTLTYETTTRAMRRDVAAVPDAPAYQLYGATEAGVLFMGRKPAASERAPRPHRPRAAAGQRAPRARARDHARPRVDAALALRHRRRRARGRVARMRVRPCERRPAARAYRRARERLRRGERRDDHAADARRCDPRGAWARRDARAVAACRRHLARRRSRVARQRVRRGPRRRGVARWPIRGEHVSAIAPEASGKYRLVKR